MDSPCVEDISPELAGYFSGKTLLTPEEQIQADGIVWELRDEWMYRWHRTRERGLVSEILQFARALTHLGKERKLALLELYGQVLEEAVMAFSPEAFECCLEVYPRMIRCLGGNRRG